LFSVRKGDPMAQAQAFKGLGRGLQSLLGASPTVSPSRSFGTLHVALMQPSAFQPPSRMMYLRL
jgi:hypothetical protein